MGTTDLTDTVITLGRTALAFGRVHRITFHDDGTTPESDTDHTVMLGLIACSIADAHLPHLNVGLVAEMALVHDLVEVYAGDTPTLRMQSADAKAAKQEREHAAYMRLRRQFAALPWVASLIAEYEALTCPEARFVKALDKLLPKITHILNDLATIRAQGMTPQKLAARYAAQEQELRGYAADFPILFDLRADLVSRVLAQYAAQTEPIA